MSPLTAEQKRRAVLQAMLRNETGGLARLTKAGKTRTPASDGQKQLWLFQQLHPKSAAYNVPQAWHWHGPVDASRLRRALAEVVQRHEILRTCYEEQEGTLWQVVKSEPAISFSEINLQATPGDKRALAAELAAKEVQQPFNLKELPLVRAWLYKLGPAEQILLLNIPHIAFDGGSERILLAELKALYNGGEVLPQPEIQYGDFSIWQSEQPAPKASTLDYWKRFELPRLQFPWADAETAPSAEGRTVEFEAPAELLAKFKQVRWPEGVTPFLVFLSAFQVLLSRLSGQREIVLGIPLSGRDRTELENLIGFFIRTLPFQNEVDPNISFLNFLEQSRDRWLELNDHQQIPYHTLAGLRARSPGSSLFNAMFVFQSEAPRALELEGARAEAMPVDIGCSKYDFTFSLFQSQEKLSGSIEHRTEIFSTGCMDRFVRRYFQILRAIIENPRETISRLAILPAAEGLQIAAWNATKEEFSGPKCIHELFEEQVKKSPDAMAVRFEGEALSYRELNCRANQIAHRLIELGVKGEELIAISAFRSIEMVAGLLGILKAGAAYVPIDPSYPAERISFMLRDCGARVLVCDAEAARALPESPAERLVLEKGGGSLRDYSTENPSQRSTPQSLAYAIYTSGSTGQPKAALNIHAGVCNRLLWGQCHFPLSPDDRLLQKTPFSFDVSVWEFFGTLISGAALVVAKPDGHRDPAYLCRVIDREKISVVHFVPSMLGAFLAEPEARQCRSVRRVVCSGEALAYELEQRFFKTLSAELLNLYGPTEASVEVTWFRCEPEAGRSCVPIGRPVANTQIHILDEQLQPVPIGVAGELHIGGIQVAKGYFNREPLTRERFIPDPFAAERERRLYKTGDLARYLPDGNIEYLGRMDYQVKIRGFRIELGEIESVLLRHASVREAVVTALPDRSGGTRLAAYVTPQPGKVLLQPELRAHCAASLPDYMTPGIFVFLENLPLNPNGKIDRGRLPATRAADDAGGEDSFVPPGNPLEQQIARIWSEVLGVSRVGLKDNFFNLGGHSLFATQVVSRVRQELAVEVPLMRLFEDPTLQQFATHVRDLRDNSAPAPAEALRRVESIPDVDQFSEEEIDKMLEGLLKG